MAWKFAGTARTLHLISEFFYRRSQNPVSSTLLFVGAVLNGTCCRMSATSDEKWLRCGSVRSLVKRCWRARRNA